MICDTATSLEANFCAIGNLYKCNVETSSADILVKDFPVKRKTYDELLKQKTICTSIDSGCFNEGEKSRFKRCLNEL